MSLVLLGFLAVIDALAVATWLAHDTFGRNGHHGRMSRKQREVFRDRKAS